jgi:hypothetical protein
MLLGLVLILAAASAADDLAGGFKGEWKSSNSGNGGEFHFVLTNVEGGMKSDNVGFTLDGAAVTAKARTVKLQDNKLDLVYDFSVQGYDLRTSHKGEWNGTDFRGTYETQTQDGSQTVDSGTWTAKRAK